MLSWVIFTIVTSFRRSLQFNVKKDTRQASDAGQSQKAEKGSASDQITGYEMIRLTVRIAVII